MQIIDAPLEVGDPPMGVPALCAVCVTLLVAAQRQITKLRERADGWRDIAIEIAADRGY